jgi:Ca2+-dependent lipid-binding protein
MGVVFTVPVGYFATKLFCDHLTIRCRLRVGLRFVAGPPYVSFISLSFLSMPSLNFSIRPLSSNGLALTDLPLVANWVVSS